MPFMDTLILSVKPKVSREWFSETKVPNVFSVLKDEEGGHASQARRIRNGQRT